MQEVLCTNETCSHLVSQKPHRLVYQAVLSPLFKWENGGSSAEGQCKIMNLSRSLGQCHVQVITL